MKLETLALIAQIVSFPVAALAIVLARMDAQRSHDLDVILNLSESFREQWEHRWRSCLNKVHAFQEKARSADVPDDCQDEVRSILNWIDWVGSFLRAGLLTRGNVLLETLGPQLSRTIELTRTKIKGDLANNGPDYWAGVVTVARRLKLPSLEDSP